MAYGLVAGCEAFPGSVMKDTELDRAGVTALNYEALPGHALDKLVGCISILEAHKALKAMCSACYIRDIDQNARVSSSH